MNPGDTAGKALETRGETALEARLLGAQMQALFASYMPSAFSGSLLALCVCATAYHLWPAPGILYWYGFHCVVRLLIPLQGRGFQRDPEALTANAPRWQRRHALEMAAFSAVWGLLPWAVPLSGGMASTAFLMIVLLGMANAGAPSLTASMPSVRGFVIPMVLGLAVHQAWQATVLSGFLAFAALLNLIISLYYARQQHDANRTVLRTRYEKEALAERLAEQVAMVQRASEEKTRFLAAASHDMRQPLHAMALFGAVLERELADHPQHVNAQYLMSALRSLSDSLDAMLDISQLDGGAIQPEVEPVALLPLLQTVGELFSHRADQKDLQLRLRSSPLWVRSDPALLQRIVSNLVDNAIKYTERGGVLVVARLRGAEVWLEVVDTGVGIEAANQSRIYDEFFQVNNPGRDRLRGLGVGLSIVQRLSRLLDHPLSLRSCPGHGSRFRLRLPLAAAPVATPPRPAPALPAARAPLARRVLLIDDDDDIAAAMGALMASLGVAFERAVDEAQARTAIAAAEARAAPFEVVLCDMRLADGADGLALAQRLHDEARATGVSAPWKVLLITGETAPEAVQRLQASGLTTLFKPVSAEVLVAALEMN